MNTSITHTDLEYRKVSFDAYNCFVDRDFSKYLASRAFLFDRCHKDGHTTFTTFLNDDEYISAIEAFQGMIPECNKKASMLQERRDLLSKYFDTVGITKECGLQCTMLYDETSLSSAINIVVFPNKEDVIKWDAVLRKLSTDRKRDAYYWFFKMRDECYFISDKTTEDLFRMAKDIEKRIKDCYAEIEEHAQEENQND